MKRLIFGLTDLADILYYHLKAEGTEISAFVINKDLVKERSHMGIPVVEFEKIRDLYPPSLYGIYLCVGYKEMNYRREAIFNELKKWGYQCLIYIHPSAVIMSKKIGEGCIILENVTVSPYTILGKCNILYPHVLIAHHTEIGDFNFFAVSCSVAGHVKIACHCFFGNNSTTKEKIKIADSVLVGASAYVNKDLSEEQVIVPPHSVLLESHKGIDFY